MVLVFSNIAQRRLTYLRRMQDESHKIKERYQKRMPVAQDERYASGNQYMQFVIQERQTNYAALLRKVFSDFSNVRLLEIGAGSGSNLLFYKQLGIKPEHIVANELISERVNMLRTNHPDVLVLDGDATLLSKEQIGQFDIIFQSTVFTSILEASFRKKLANNMMHLLKENGVILWYDFVYDNPSNPDVKGVSVRELKALFPGLHWEIKRVTLAPPIGRRVKGAYAVFNAFPFLRTHIVALGRK